jgi:hypothetical protein
MREHSGVLQMHDQWWWKDPETKETHGPFDKRAQARLHGRKIRELTQANIDTDGPGGIARENTGDPVAVAAADCHGAGG